MKKLKILIVLLGLSLPVVAFAADPVSDCCTRDMSCCHDGTCPMMRGHGR